MPWVQRDTILKTVVSSTVDMTTRGLTDSVLDPSYMEVEEDRWRGRGCTQVRPHMHHRTDPDL